MVPISLSEKLTYKINKVRTQKKEKTFNQNIVRGK